MNKTDLINTIKLNKEITKEINDKCESEYDNLCEALDKCIDRWEKMLHEYFPEEIMEYLKEICDKNRTLSIPIDGKRWLGNESCVIRISMDYYGEMCIKFEKMWKSELERYIYFDGENTRAGFLPDYIKIGGDLQYDARLIKNGNELADVLEKYIANIYQEIANISNNRLKHEKQKLSDICNASAENGNKKKIVITIEEV